MANAPADRVAGDPLLRLEDSGWTAALLPGQGGAMASLAFQGRDVLVPLPLGADPNTSFCGAFIMAPWANRLADGRLPVAGTEYRLPINHPWDDTAIHGLSREHPWRVEAASPGHVVLVQEIDAESLGLGLPWRYAAHFELTLRESGAEIALRLTNAADLPFPFGLGWHPFLARPPGTRLRFHASTLLSRDGRGLPVAVQPSTGLNGPEAAYDGLDTHFAGWDGVVEIARPDLRLRLAAEGAWARNLQIFAPAGGTVLCVEPVSHVPDAPNRPEFTAYGPLVMLPPGAVLGARLALAAEI
ncbi:MAG: aldose epimerase [Acetobacteraceae bacterium]|nr:aldose epimerase [Acetobacteraceae bacterium]